ncbi:MAG: TIGR00730 family Rossman fold protein [Planctomycetes bacterium]|nr:TIGR00730 family Rossman fold protein [Planctomycetota bacterium]
MAEIQSVCVYCGSQSGTDPAYADAARQMGDALAERGLRLVFGGGHVGMMGLLADRVLARGGEVIGVIPKALMRAEVAHDGLTELHVTEDMHQRKALMAEHSDAFVTLPGGLGTLEELFETWTWRQLRYHDKPLGLLNVNGYFDGLLDWLDHAVAKGYVRAPYREMLQVDTDPAALLDQLMSVHCRDET